MASERQYKQCVSPCPRYITDGDTHSLVLCASEQENARAVLDGAACVNCELMPLRMLRQGGAAFTIMGIANGAG